ncbi:UvrB/UvrC motif-containing protein [Cytobacillus sp. NCCP-133]|uniref:UvrB/UvrC motif-containing protein n=1 Tax=Cytobacillus sp. NCCP-133 TaxID=766848 RepID=UPI002230F622|nr:UvrB/UvrC motif-containing protein [Cytobacillus sp. NCCP-133]GLB61414.1 protein-arginine kinase activator protein [Cytobacillus sp. NCCP-133]
MICQECNQRPATLHFTKIINGEKAEFHLCEKCAHEKGEMFMLGSGSGFSINNLLAGLLNIEPAFQGSNKDPFQQEKVLQCEQCSMTFQQFIKIGRFGCAHCYEAFKEQLSPILRRLHSGNTAHNGKIPARIGGTIHLRRNIDEFKHKLKEMIAQEEFEQAAELRDEIRKLEKQLNDNHEGGG